MAHQTDASETERVRRIQDRTAPRYDCQISFFERILFGGAREWVCSQATGDVLELAAGTGRNLAHYPPDIRLTAIELSPEMLAIAKRRARELGSDADLREGDAQALASTRSSSRSGCARSPTIAGAVGEAYRVLRPGGRLLLLEHVRSPSLPVRVGQRLLNPLAVRFEADHLLRDPLDHLEAEGFELERVERSKWGIVELVAARKPAGNDEKDGRGG